MAGVHKKRVETLRRKAKAALLGKPAVIKIVSKTPGTPSSLAAIRNRHVRKTSLVSEQLELYLDNNPKSTAQQNSVSRPDSATLDAEMLDIEAIYHHDDEIDNDWEEESLSPVPSHSSLKPTDDGYSGRVTGRRPKSIEFTTTGRRYGSYQGMCVMLPERWRNLEKPLLTCLCRQNRKAGSDLRRPYSGRLPIVYNHSAESVGLPGPVVLQDIPQSQLAW